MMKGEQRQLAERARFALIARCLSGPDPLYALQLLHDLELYGLVFSPPPGERLYAPTRDVQHPHVDFLGWAPLLTPSQLQPVEDYASSEQGGCVLRAASLLSSARSRAKSKESGDGNLADNHAGFVDSLDARLIDVLKDPEHCRRLFYAVSLLPLRHKLCKEKKKFVWAGEKTMMEGLKLGAKHTKDPLVCIYRSLDLLSACTHDALYGARDPPLPHLWPKEASPQARLCEWSPRYLALQLL